MKKLILIALFAIFQIKSEAQTATQYSFVRTSASATNIAGDPGAVTVTAISDDDETLTGIPIGFNFVFCGATYASLSACSNGWMSLSNSSETYYSNTSGNIQGPGFFMPFWDDLDGSVGSATAYYGTFGTAPTRAFVFQWGSTGSQRWGNLTGSGRGIFQVILYESSNVVEFAYGNGNFSGNSATIGIANSSSDRLTLSSNTATTAGTGFSTGVASWPGNGTSMTWTPPPFLAVSPSSLAFAAAPGGTSIGMNVTVRAFGLSGNVTVTAPANYQVYNGSAWVSSASIVPAAAGSGTYVNTTIPVRFVGPATIGSYPASLSFSATGATTQTVSLNGSVTAPCSGTPAAGSISASASSGSCFPYNTTLTLTGAAVSAGISYQWQSSTDGAVWANVAGASSTMYNTLVSSDVQYRCMVSCGALSAYTAPVSLTYSSCIIMPSSGTSSVTTCGGAFYDNGGPSGEYSDDVTSTLKVYPGTPEGKVRVSFSMMDMEGCCDEFSIYNGDVVSGANLLGTYSGSSTPPAVTSTAANGALTFVFISDYSVTYDGFAGTITNVQPNPITTQPAPSTATCVGNSPVLSLAVGAGSYTYQWMNNGTTNANTGGTAITGATSTSYSPSTASTGTTYYYCRVTNGCNVSVSSAVAAVVVDEAPAAIAGLSQVCTGNTISLTNSTTTGTWSSSNAAIAGVSGVAGAATVSGVSQGTANISYRTSPACFVTKAITINATPSAITGTAQVCESGNVTLNQPDGGSGAWSSSNAAVATVGLSSGIVSGNTSGYTTISYTATNNCYTTKHFTVNPLPAVAVSPASDAVCLGESATFTASSDAPEINLLSEDFNGTLSGWTITSGSGVPAANEWQLVAPPGTAGFTVNGDGSQYLQASSSGYAGFTTTTIESPSFQTTGSFTSVTLSFNQSLLSFNPDIAVSVEYSVNGGAWTELVNQVTGPTVVINDGGTWDAASPEFSMSLPPAAVGQNDVRIRFVYNAQSLYWSLDNVHVKGTMPASTFTWDASPELSCTNCATTTVTPLTATTNAYNVVTTTSAGCIRNTPVTVTVNPLPSPVTSGLVVCTQANSTLASTPGGTWSSGTPAIAIVSSLTGELTGVAAGTADITYTLLTTGCSTTAVATVLPSPAEISPATAQVCVGSVLTLANSDPGVWSSSNAAVATVSATGDVHGVMQGVATISYTNANGCFTLREVTVNPLPGPITGAAAVCENGTTTLGNTDIPGSWSSADPGVAAVNSASGEVTGITGGNTIISYTLTGGCYAVKSIQVNPAPAPVTGAALLCQGGVTALGTTSAGGEWSSSAPAIAAVNSLGIVTASTTASGTAAIRYTYISTGCSREHLLTVSPRAVISGQASVCKGFTITLSADIAGGTWSSSNSAVASVDAAGTVSGSNTGNATISYTSPDGCISVHAVAVKPLPLAILGADLVCEGTSTHMINATGDIGVWGSSNSSVATIDTEGLVTAVAPSGEVTISYTSQVTGCTTAKTITVSPLPAAIIGNTAICAGSTMPLGNVTPDGTWSSSYPAIAAIDTFGNVTGRVHGNATITYMLPTGCMQTHPVVVNALPPVSSGAASVCEGQQTTFSNLAPNGTWSTSSAVTATIDAVTGVVTGMDAGTVDVVYTLPTGCSRSRTLTVNDMPDAISGVLSTCPGTATTVNSMPAGGVWSTGSASVATVSADGVVTGVSAGVTKVTYTLMGSCRVMADVTINTLPDVITGVRTICPGSTTTLVSGGIGGTWNVANTSIADVNTNTGEVTGNAAGVTAVTYTLPTGCARSANVTVNPLPELITGPIGICAGSTALLSNITPGGSWSSANTSIATINGDGEITGVGAGIVNISYTLPTGCMSTTAIDVYDVPSAISGDDALCAGSQITLGNTLMGGVWSSSDMSVASVDASGVVSGMLPGSATIRYTMNATGCYKEKNIVVNALPATISGGMSICAGGSSLLTNVTPGGVWSSSNPVVAQVNVSGNVTGTSAGISVISYTLPTGCGRTATVVVNALPDPVTGVLSLCAGGTTLLESATPGGIWSSNGANVTVNAAGLVKALAAGTAQVAYTNSNGCKRTVVVTVNALPGLINGSATVCPGLTTTLVNSTPGGVWSSSNSAMVSVNSITGEVTATGSDGMVDITYTLPSGCVRSRQITIHPSVSPVTGVSTVCKGDISTLGTTSTGGVWVSSNTFIATVSAAGVVNGLQPGTVTIAYVMPTGCKAETGFVVNPVPAGISGPAAVCEGAAVVLTNSSTGGMWSSADGSIATIDGDGMVTGVAAGSTTVTYEFTTGCRVVRSIIVNPLPVAMTVTGGGSYCEGGAGVLVGVDGSELSTQYRLLHGTSTVQTVTGSGAAFDFARQTSAGTYMVTATSPAGCVRSMNGSAAVSINSLVTVSVTVSSDMGDRVCNGSSVTYTANGVNGGTTPLYDWKVNGTSVAATPTYNYVPADGDVVSVAYTSSEACPVNATVNGAMTMEVLANLTPSVSITATTGDTLCDGNTATFAATAVNGGDAAMYTWVVNGNTIAGVTGSGYSYVPADNDVVKVMLNSSYECVTENDVNSNSVTMQVDEIYVPIVELMVSPGLVVAEGTAVTFTANAIKAGTAPTYQWLVNGNVVNGATQPAYTTAKLNNGDSVTCVVMATDRCNNTSINSVVMTVTPATGVVMTGLSQSELRLIPNPNTGVFRVTGTLGVQTEEEVQLEVTNMLGQVVYHGVAKSRGGVLDAGIELGNNLANGMYMLNLTLGADHKAFHFVVKQ